MENVVNFRKAGLRPLVCATAIFLLFNSSFAQNFSGGNGSQSNPYIITTAAELAQLATYVNAGDTNYNDKRYKLANNINLSAYGAGFNSGKGWIPIGQYLPAYNPFKGFFDGDSNRITGLYINDSTLYSGAGLFGSIECESGKVGGVAFLNVDSVNIRGGIYVGGIVGHTTRANLLMCSSSGNISGGGYVGGLIGQALAPDGPPVLLECYSSSNVSGGSYVGGIVGMSNFYQILNCYSTGNISGNESVGGIVGEPTNYTHVLDCYSTGNVTGNRYVGGIAGYVKGSNLIRCYSTGLISGNWYVGGIAGKAGNYSCKTVLISNCVALNPSVQGESYVGRILGDSIEIAGVVTVEIGNAAYDSILTQTGDIIWLHKSVGDLDGEDISKETINADGTLGGRFTNTTNPFTNWTTQNGKLPGFGKAVDMPPHLRMSGEVGVVEPHNYADLQVYPNPTTGQLTIESVELKIERVEILDILGQCVLTTPNPSKGGESSTSAQFPSFGGAGVVIDVSHLASGMYFLKVGNKVVRFVKE